MEHKTKRIMEAARLPSSTIKSFYRGEISSSGVVRQGAKSRSAQVV